MSSIRHARFNLVEAQRGREVSFDSRVQVYKINSHKATDEYKKTYDTFVFEKNDSALLSKLRDWFNATQAKAYLKHPPIIARLITFLLTPAARIEKYGNFLDIGCSSGIFLKNLPQEWKKYGMDINENACKIAKERYGIQVQNSTMEEYKSDVKYTFMRASHVIEHIDDYDRFVAKCAALLEPGGRLMIMTPNGSSLSGKLFGRYWESFYDDTHWTIFTSSGLTKAMRKHGMSLVEQKTYSMGTFGSSLNRVMGMHNTIVGSLVYFFLWFLLLPLDLMLNRFMLGDALSMTYTKGQV